MAEWDAVTFSNKNIRISQAAQTDSYFYYSFFVVECDAVTFSKKKEEESVRHEMYGRC